MVENNESVWTISKKSKYWTSLATIYDESLYFCKKYMLTTWAPYDSLSLFQNNIANTHEEPGSTAIKALFFFIPVLILDSRCCL